MLALIQGRELQQLKIAQHPVQRGTDFMAHGGQKQGLGLAGFIGRELCLLHQVGVIHMPGDVVETAQHHVFSLVPGEYKADLQITTGYFKLDLTRLALTVITLQ